MPNRPFYYYDHWYVLVLVFMLFEFEERDILYKNTFEHNSPFWIQCLLLLMSNKHLMKDMTFNFQMTHILRKSEVRCWLYTWKPETFYYLNKSTNVCFIVPWSKLSTVWNGWNKSWCCLDPLHSNSYQFFTDHNNVLIIHTIVGVVLWM